jgi:hypothetical protein
MFLVEDAAPLVSRGQSRLAWLDYDAAGRGGNALGARWLPLHRHSRSLCPYYSGILPVRRVSIVAALIRCEGARAEALLREHAYCSRANKRLLLPLMQQRCGTSAAPGLALVVGG